MKKNSIFNIPNMLCYFRVAVIPVMAVLFYFDSMTMAWLNLFVFALAGISDFLDGMIARATGQTSLYGKFLDSSTDKMLVGATLVLLIAFDRIEGGWIALAMLIYLREILISGVREFMALYNVIVPISRMGKWKLTMQIFALGWFVVGDYGNVLVPHTIAVGKFLLIVATVLTVASGWDYMRGAWTTLKKIEGDGQEPTVVAKTF